MPTLIRMMLVKPALSCLRLFIRSSRYDICIINSLVLLSLYVYFVETFYFYSFCNGVALATLAEYLYHRFVLHYSTDGTLYYYLHGHHHLKPHSSSIHLPILYVDMNHAITIYIGSHYFTMPHVFSAMIAGILTYMTFEFIHKEVHQPNLLTRENEPIRMFHMYHHTRNKNLAYGFTVPTWDILFGTFPDDILCYNPLALLPIPFLSFYYGVHDTRDDVI